MSEKILLALIKLFALVYDGNGNGKLSSERLLVKSFLKRLLNSELVEKYLQLFDEFVIDYHGGIDEKEGTKLRKRASLNAMKILSICEKINEELQKEQKVLVLFQLLEFISFGKEPSEQENDVTETVADAFKIDDTEFKNCRQFVFNTALTAPDIEDILVINNIEDFDSLHQKHIYSANLVSGIAVFHVKSVNQYFFKFDGKEELFLNSQSIQPGRIYNFDKGSSIRGPKIHPIYYSDIAGRFIETQSNTKVNLTAEDVVFRFKGSQNGIQNFNFSEESGQLVGIMGGSGVGKSTLLNVLNGSLRPQSGKITINGFDIYEEKEKVQGMIGFIPQDDLLIEELSVYQNLYYCAKLCFGNLPEERIKESVEKVLRDLDLYLIKDLTVGSPLNKFISGGQRKRLNIALELIREPYVLFVDEPTSGLSSMDSEMVMDLLKEQTLKGKLLIVNIHQPSSDIFKMFDKLIFMDKGGYPIYYGNPSDSVIYFKTVTDHINSEESHCIKCGNVNPEQVLQIIESKVVDEYGKLTRNRKVSPKEWHDLFTQNIVPGLKKKDYASELPKSDFSIPDLFKQLKIFIARDLLSKITNTQYMVISLLEAPLLAIILAYVTRYISPENIKEGYIFYYNENLTAYIFMSVVVALFLGLTVSAEEIIKDRKICQREAFLNLSRFSYLNSKVLILFLLSAIQTFTFVLIGNYLIGIKGLTTNYWLVLFTTSCLANIMGLTISSAFKSVITVYILIPFILVPQLIFSGLIVKFEKLNNTLSSYEYVPAIGDLMTSRWAYEALAVEQFKNNKFQKNFFEIDRRISNNVYFANSYIPQLQTKIGNIKRDVALNNALTNTADDYQLIRNEINWLEKKSTQPFSKPDLLNSSSFNADLIAEIENYLVVQRKHYLTKLNTATKQKDEIYNKLKIALGGDNEVLRLKQDYSNSNLNDIVINGMEIKNIREYNGRLVRIKDPIYEIPENNFGRAKLYSSVKFLFGREVDTYWFNIGFIWLTVILMYFILYYDLLRKLLEFLGNLKLRK